MVTRDRKTIEKYIIRANYLIKKAYKEAVEKPHPIAKEVNAYKDDKGQQFLGLSVLNTCVWFKKYWAIKLSSSTVRYYRASLSYYAELEKETGQISQDVFNKIKNTLSNLQAGSKKDLELRTSAKKQKHLTLKDFSFLDDALKNSKNRWAKPTRIWLHAGIISGLRPIEWQQTLYDKDEDKLIIKNAKNTNGRSHGEFRTIHLSHLDNFEKTILLQHLKVATQFYQSGNWDTYYEGCGNLLKYTANKIWPSRKRHPTLYSARHQFSANLKASGCRPEELAALMGHAVDDTAMTTYGKKVNGTRGLKPTINAEEVKRVRKSGKNVTFTINQALKNKNKK